MFQKFFVFLILSTETMVLKAALADVSNCQFLSDRLRAYKGIMETKMKEKETLLHCLPTGFIVSKEFALAAVRHNGQALPYILASLNWDFEIVQAALHQTVSAYRFIADNSA